MKSAWLAVASLALASACSRPTARTEWFEAEISGCAAIVAGPVCELPADRTVRVFVRAPKNDVVFPSAQSSLIREVGGGALFRVVVAENADAIAIAVRGSPRSLRVGAPSTPSWLARAKELRQSGDKDGALALAGEHPRDAFALGLRGRIELAAGRPDASFPLFREAIALHRKAGRVSDAADDSFALAFALNQRSYRYEEARAVLDAVRPDVVGYPDGRVREAYYRGQLATETGDARAALGFLERARDGARRLGLAQLERNAINAYALELELLGRTKEARDTLGTLQGESACEKAEIAVNVGYGALLENERTGKAELDAVAPLERALAAGCSDVYLAVAASGNLALAALQRGDTQAARAHLARASRGNAARGAETLSFREIEGRIALAENDARRALDAFDEEARLAGTLYSFEAAWRAEVGRGEALEKLARAADAIAAYRKAEDLLADVGFLVPLGEGRGTFLGDRSRSARLAIDLLVRKGRAEDALAIARVSRARVVAALARTARVEGLRADERARWEKALGAYREKRAAIDAAAKDDWKLPREDAAKARQTRAGDEAAMRRALDDALAAVSASRPELPALPHGVTTLAFHPARKGWAVIVADDQGTDAAIVDDPTAPFRARLERAKRLRILAWGSLRRTDFHALLPGVAVEYPLDVPRAAASAEGDRAAVVFDPTLDLRSTHGEADHVISALRNTGWNVEALGGAKATSAAVLPLLAQVRFFHYAGHGVFGGREAMESFLPLAAGGHLALADILAADAVPARVVLSGCETARAADDAAGESLGIAQAFVLAGADFVIAPARPVDDVLAARLAKALYGPLADRSGVDAAAVLREAIRRERAESPALDWDAFRVLTR